MKLKKIISILFIIAIFKAAVFSFFGFGLVDEGESLHNAVRILSGQIAYRDFFAIFPPIDNYVYAIIFFFFGKSILIPRIVESIIFSFFPILYFLTARKIIADKWAFLLSIFLIFVDLNVERLFFFTPIFLALYILISNKNKLKRKHSFVAGLLLGFVSMLRADIPAVYTISITLGLSLYWFYTDRKYIFTLIKFLNFFILGLAIAPMLFLLWSIIHNVSLSTLYEFLIIKPTLITKLHDLPFPKLLDLIPRSLAVDNIWNSYGAWIAYSLVVTYIVGLIYLIFNWKRLWTKSPEMGTFLFSGILALPYVLGRTELGHIVKGGLPFFTLLVYLLDKLIKRNSVRSTIISVVLIGFILSQLVLSLWWLGFNNSQIIVGSDVLRINSIYKQNTTLPSAATIQKTVKFVQTNSKTNEPVLLLPYFAGLYYLTNRPSPTEFNNVLAGFMIAEEKQKTFIEKLEKQNVRVVVYDPKNGPAMKNNTLKEYNSLIDEYVMNNFKEVDKTPEGWLLMLKK